MRAVKSPVAGYPTIRRFRDALPAVPHQSLAAAHGAPDDLPSGELRTNRRAVSQTCRHQSARACFRKQYCQNHCTE
jgi:hypothetical protein